MYVYVYVLNAPMGPRERPPPFPPKKRKPKTQKTKRTKTNKCLKQQFPAVRRPIIWCLVPGGPGMSREVGWG